MRDTTILSCRRRQYMFGFKGDTPDRTPQVGFCGCCLIGAIGMSLSDKSMIFGSGKSWNVGLNHEKVFTPSESFLPPFWALDATNRIFKFFNFSNFHEAKRGVKNFLMGQKTFPSQNMQSQLLSESKIRFISQILIESQ